MKRFSWPLQRLLDLALQREHILRGQLAKLANEIRSLRQQVRRIRQDVAERLSELARQELAQRLSRREVFLRWATLQEVEIAQRQEQVRTLQEQRVKLLEQFYRNRSTRQTFERLRDESLLRYRKEVSRAQQGRLDEAAQSAHARGMIQRRLRQPHEVTR